MPILSGLSWGCTAIEGGQLDQPSGLSYVQVQPQVISLSGAPPDRRVGSLVAADVNGDGQRDFIVTKPNYLAVYSHTGQELWAKSVPIQVNAKAESNGLPGTHAPGVQVADGDGDRQTEILFLTQDGSLQIVDGATGITQHTVALNAPSGAERWEHLVIVNFRGEGDRDLLLQATNADGYRMGRYLAAYALDDLRSQEPQPLWTRDDFVANAHNGARVADLNGDGRDEVLGGTIVSPDGEILAAIPVRGHIDSVFVADVRPDIPGLEVVALEEGGSTYGIFPGDSWLSRAADRAMSQIAGTRNRIFLYNTEQLIWTTHFNHQEPQNAAVGDFDPDRPGLEIWCRSRYNENQKPFVFDAEGKLIANYNMEEVAPAGWTARGVEVIFPIDWTGDSKQLAAAKERHTAGDVAIFDPISGRFPYRFEENADRLYVADVSGDWREELVVLNSQELRIYSNPETNPNLNRSSLWQQNHYHRSKMTWNYYSP